MTAIVGVLCKDGVVIGADSSATLTQGRTPTIEQSIEKLHLVDNHIVVAGTGAVGLDQRFCAIVENAWRKGVFKGSPLEVGKCLSKETIIDFSHTHLNPGQLGALVAFPVENKPYLCEFALVDFQPELKTDSLWYVSMGSSQPITDPFLALMREFFWQEGPPTTQDAVFAVTWTLEHAIKVNPGGVNAPIRVAVLERGKNGKLLARVLDGTELQQHQQNVEALKCHIREFRDKHQPEVGPDLPESPKKP